MSIRDDKLIVQLIGNITVFCQTLPSCWEKFQTRGPWWWNRPVLFSVSGLYVVGIWNTCI